MRIPGRGRRRRSKKNRAMRAGSRIAMRAVIAGGAGTLLLPLLAVILLVSVLSSIAAEQAGARAAAMCVVSPSSSTPAAGGGAVGQASPSLVLGNGQIDLVPRTRLDLENDIIDHRLLGILQAASAEFSFEIGTLASGHSSSGLGSNHPFGRGADITRVDGEIASPGSDATRRLAERLGELFKLSGLPTSAWELGAPWDIDGPGGWAFTDADHKSHIHIGIDGSHTPGVLDDPAGSGNRGAVATGWDGLYRGPLAPVEPVANEGGNAAGAQAAAVSANVTSCGCPAGTVPAHQAAPASPLGALPSGVSVGDIPPEMLPYYQAGARAVGVPWTLVAAIGHHETNHGRTSFRGSYRVSDDNPLGWRLVSVSSAGALGPMQFMKPTWDAYGVDGDGDGVLDVTNPVDAIFGAANYLAANGADSPGTVAKAVWHYNHSQAYVDDVLATAAEYVAAASAAGASDLGYRLDRGDISNPGAGASAPPAPPSDISDPTAIAAWIVAKAPRSRLAASASVFSRAGIASGIDPRLLVVIAWHETRFGTRPGSGRFDLLDLPSGARASSFAQAIRGGAAALRRDMVVSQGASTIRDLAAAWEDRLGPRTSSEDPELWVARVSALFAELGGEPAGAVVLTTSVVPAAGGVQDDPDCAGAIPASFAGGQTPGVIGPGAGAGPAPEQGGDGAGPLTLSAAVFPISGQATFSNDYLGARGGGGGGRGCPAGRHCATDVFADRGTPILAPVTGSLYNVGWNTYGGWRLWVTNGSERFYLAHMTSYAPGIRNGVQVTAGQVLGYVGDTGSARGTPPHLHIQWDHRLPDGAWTTVNPYFFLKAAQAAAGGASLPSFS